jgi:hypothetical protein
MCILYNNYHRNGFNLKYYIKTIFIPRGSQLGRQVYETPESDYDSGVNFEDSVVNIKDSGVNFKDSGVNI